MKKRGQIGMVGGLVFGIASVIVSIIIAFVIISNIGGSNILKQENLVIVNETGGWLNQTNYQLTNFAGTNTKTPSITAIWGAQGGLYNVSIPVANATVTSAGVVTNATVYTNANVSYTYSFLRDSKQIITASGLSGNMSSGVDNLSGKIPTVLLVAAIVLILGILATLVTIWQKMKMGGSL